MYISRRAIPGFKDVRFAPDQYFKQVCIYAYTADELKQYFDYGEKSLMEKSEDIEILRFFEWGKNVRLVETEAGSLAVDEQHDVRQVEKVLGHSRNV